VDIEMFVSVALLLIFRRYA